MKHYKKLTCASCGLSAVFDDPLGEPPEAVAPAWLAIFVPQSGTQYHCPDHADEALKRAETPPRDATTRDAIADRWYEEAKWLGAANREAATELEEAAGRLKFAEQRAKHDADIKARVEKDDAEREVRTAVAVAAVQRVLDGASGNATLLVTAYRAALKMMAAGNLDAPAMAKALGGAS